MCGIVGMAGNINRELLESVLKSINHRGEDYSNTFIDEEKGIGLGHNLLSIFNHINENNEIIDSINDNKQPIILDNLVLVFNGEIYNFNKLEEYLKENDENYSKSKSDSQLYPYSSGGRQTENHNHRKLTNLITGTTAFSNSVEL